jgi:hypothetical protein
MKLKKHISLLLTILILISNIGLALNVHYCHNSVSSVTLSYKVAELCNDHKQEQKTCCAAAGKKHKSCCESNVVKLQDKTDNIIVKSLQLDLAPFCMAGEWVPAQYYSIAPQAKKQNPSFYCEANAPPLFKLYCQYIFYA